MPPSDATRRPPAPSPFARGFDYGAATALGRQALDQWTRAMFEYANELSLFAMGRVGRDFDVWRALVNCSSIGEIVHCQYDFAQRAAEDYASAIGRLSALILGFAGTAFAASAPAQPKPPVEAAAWQLTPASPAATAAPRPGTTRARHGVAAKTAADRDA